MPLSNVYLDNITVLRLKLTSLVLGFLAAWVMLASPAQALVTFDFEQKYLTHKDHQIWDFSLIRPDSVYHAFYHTIHESTPHSSHGDTIWHSTSPDLKHWTIEGPILTVGQGYWDEGAIWAPDVFWDGIHNRYGIAYTGCDATMNQRICMAYSEDLYVWEKSSSNPTVEPDPTEYLWNTANGWANFRDAFVYEENDQYHMLVTAKKWVGQTIGAIFHAVSDDLENWVDQGPFFLNDGDTPSMVMESCQYHQKGQYHHLLFGEYGLRGVSHLSSREVNALSMSSRQIIDGGTAPEIDTFDPDINIFSRLANYEISGDSITRYVVRFDTLTFDASGEHITIEKPHPLAEKWASYSGFSCYANPTFGDNPSFRGDDATGMVGNSYFGSGEFYQGPLSGRGAPGSNLGDGMTITSMESFPFVIVGDRMTLLVGGGNYPETLYVALMDASTNTALYSETGTGQELMTPREWDLIPHKGKTAYIKICDSETGTMGHINVDEIKELVDETSAANDLELPSGIGHHFAFPNPFNPRTNIHFNLSTEMDVNIRIHDVRGSIIWESGHRHGARGENSVSWLGNTTQGLAAPAGIYLYSIETLGRIAASGKISLVK